MQLAETAVFDTLSEAEVHEMALRNQGHRDVVVYPLAVDEGVAA
jgi:hypothetical protein